MEYYSIVEAACILSRTYSSVNVYILTGKLPAVKSSGVWLVEKADVLKLKSQLTGYQRHLEEGYLTIDEAAKIINRSNISVREYIFQGRLPAEKRNGMWAIKKCDLEEFRGKLSKDGRGKKNSCLGSLDTP